MSTTLPPADRSFRRRWTEFWFKPGDPTTLGFMRIVTGLLVIYTHLAYSLDLQAFFGRYGWYGTEYVERERHEFPWNVSSFWGWDESNDAGARVPEFPDRRKAVIRFIRGLPADPGERARAVRYLEKATQENDVLARGSLYLITRLYSVTPQDREAMLTLGLERGKQYYAFEKAGKLEYDVQAADSKSEPIFPPYLLAMPDQQRKEAAEDIRALFQVLPKDKTDTEFLISHLAEGLDNNHRRAFAKFLVSLPADDAERNRIIDYLEYWNYDRDKVYRRGNAIFSVWFHVTEPAQMALIHGLALTVMVLFTIGFCTRVTAVLTWIAVVGYIHRTNQILFGMDTMMNILLIYLMIGNSGAALSVDRLIAKYRAVRASLRRCGTIDEPTRAFLEQAPPSVGANFGVRMIQVHFCFIYMAAGLSKLKGPPWWYGNAFWDVMINPEFTLLRYTWFEDAVRWMFANEHFGKPLYFAVTSFGVWFTWGIEIAFPFLVWTRLRSIMLWLAVFLHAGIGVLMGLNLFELLMMTMLLVYFPAGVIRDRLRGDQDLKKLNYAFDPNDPKQARGAALLAALDTDTQVTANPARGRDTPTVTAPDEKPLHGTEAVTAIFNDLRLLRIFRWALVIPGVAALFTRWLAPNGKGNGTHTPAPPTAATAS